MTSVLGTDRVLCRLTLQMEAMNHSKPEAGEGEAAGGGAALHTELKIAQEELDTMARLNSRLGYEIKRNELALSNMMNNYDGRQQFARRLEADVTKAETQTRARPAAAQPSKPGLNKIEVSRGEAILAIISIQMLPRCHPAVCCCLYGVGVGCWWWCDYSSCVN